MMIITKEHIRYSIHLAFHLQKNAAKVVEMINTAYNDNVVSHATCKNWYKTFCNGDFDMKNQPRSKRIIKFESDKLQALLN